MFTANCSLLHFMYIISTSLVVEKVGGVEGWWWAKFCVKCWSFWRLSLEWLLYAYILSYTCPSSSFIGQLMLTQFPGQSTPTLIFNPGAGCRLNILVCSVVVVHGCLLQFYTCWTFWLLSLQRLSNNLSRMFLDKITHTSVYC